MRELQKFSYELYQMRKNIDKIIESFFKPQHNKETENEIVKNSFVPPVNAVENENEIKLYVLLPFAKKENISVNIKENILWIEGNSSFNVSDKEEILREEIPYGSFSRSFKVANNIETSKIKANYKDGILEIILPKKEEAKINKINID